MSNTAYERANLSRTRLKAENPRRKIKRLAQLSKAFFYKIPMQNRGMIRNEIISSLQEYEAELRAKGVAHAALLGSVACNEQKPDSDIMVEIAPDANIGLYQYVSIIHYLEDRFPIRVDVANRSQLKPYVRPSAERDAVYAF